MSDALRPARAFAVTTLHPGTTSEGVKWAIEETVQRLLQDIEDPRLGEITISHYDGTPAQVRALWEPDRQ